MIKSIKLDVFGKIVLAIWKDNAWEAFYLDSEGKRRKATDIQIPTFVNESDIETYLTDLCHEWASDKYPTVRCMD
ncbi:MAG: hypothetical protein KAR20_01920 [Candidatus Heimdallarchaeota archaeon]|nr:hypothetical protein [Candidatus Heimdallarchaeota archaeon]